MVEEIARLRELKGLFIKKALKLRNILKQHEENGQDVLSSDDESDISFRLSLSDKYEAKLCRISSHVTGITFRDVNKKWLRDNVYLYTAKVVTKMVSFNLELTVFFKNSDNFKVCNIMCYLVGIDNYAMLEISPWFQKIIKTNNFSLLMSALSDYNEYSILRSKILHNLESKKNVTVEQCTEGDGGILVYLHSSADTGRNYVIFQWRLKFLDFTWHIEHFFTMRSTDIGTEFFEKNHALLKKFRQTGLTRSSLIELWNTLCVTIDTYYAKSTKTAS